MFFYYSVPECDKKSRLTESFHCAILYHNLFTVQAYFYDLLLLQCIYCEIFTPPIYFSLPYFQEIPCSPNLKIKS